jgi:DNA-binding response OmpR family regulator
MPIKMLIVEPDAALRLSFDDLLAHAGLDVIEARTFQEARRIIRDHAPGLLVTELRLAGFNGLQLIITSPKPLRGVVLGHADPVLVAEAERLGAIYLVRPFTHAELLDAVEHQIAAVAPEDGTSPKRRWTRKAVNAELRASIDDSPARVLDVSYGGLRVEVERASERPLPRRFSVKLTAADIDFPVDLVWSRTDERGWECGVALSRMGQIEASAWRGLVDMIS